MIAICERTSIEITLENATNYAVYALLRLFSIIDVISRLRYNVNDTNDHHAFYPLCRIHFIVCVSLFILHPLLDLFPN